MVIRLLNKSRRTEEIVCYYSDSINLVFGRVVVTQLTEHLRNDIEVSERLGNKELKGVEVESFENLNQKKR